VSQATRLIDRILEAEMDVAKTFKLLAKVDAELESLVDDLTSESRGDPWFIEKPILIEYERISPHIRAGILSTQSKLESWLMEIDDHLKDKGLSSSVKVEMKYDRKKIKKVLKHLRGIKL